MILSDAVGALGSAGNELPREAMQWSLDHWDQAGPRFLQILEDYATGADRPDEAGSVVFFALHLMGQHGETRAFPALCRLLHDGEAADELLGDAITETLRGILIGTFDGDLPRLQSVIEDAATDDFIRQSCLLVMAYLARTGRVAAPVMRAYLQRLLTELDPEIEEVVVGGVIAAVAHLGYADMAPQIEALLQSSTVEYPLYDIPGFQADLAASLADPEGMVGFEDEHVRPLTDAIGTLAMWHSFSPDATDDWLDDGADDGYLPGAGEPLINPFRHVGRNDSCPCGSGKKFKRCCLELMG